MQPESDTQLLRAYVERGTEAAFTELVHRHTNLVYSAAWRQVDSAEAAAEIAQNVFIGLARSAHTLLPRLTAEASLAGWLCRCARNLSLNHRRSEFRRQVRERQAMEQLLETSDAPPDWNHLRQTLDDAMAELDEPDYDALVLRFFEQQDYRRVGVALGVSDDNAQKRVARALEKLRDHLSRRGIRTTAAALSLAITANAVQAAPAGLAVAISSAAALSGAAVSSSTLIAATKAIAMTTLQKTLLTVTIAALTGAGIYEARQTSQLRAQNQVLQGQQTPLAEENQRLLRERDSATKRLAELLAENARLKSNTDQNELLRLRGEVTQFRMAETQRKNDQLAAMAANWAAKANQLKQRIQQTPGEDIPELQLLGDRDWLSMVSEVPNLDSEYHWSFASSRMRKHAKDQFVNLMGPAMADYLVANNGQLPTDLSELKPYIQQFLAKPSYPEIQRMVVTDSMFPRYQLLQSGNVSELQPTETLISEIPVTQQGQYEARFKLGAFDYSYEKIDPAGSSGSGEIYGPSREALKKLFKSP